MNKDILHMWEISLRNATSTCATPSTYYLPFDCVEEAEGFVNVRKPSFGGEKNCIYKIKYLGTMPKEIEPVK